MTDAIEQPKRCRLASDTHRRFAHSMIRDLPNDWTVTFHPPRRSDVQSEKMHAMLGEISKQTEWCGAKLSVEDWKRVATAMLKKDKFVRDVNDDGQPGNGLIVIGARTREMGVKEISLVIEWLYWFGAKNGVVFRDQREAVA